MEKKEGWRERKISRVNDLERRAPPIADIVKTFTHKLNRFSNFWKKVEFLDEKVQDFKLKRRILGKKFPIMCMNEFSLSHK